MRFPRQFSLFALLVLPFLLPSCGNRGDTASHPGSPTGPFDSRGNYREEWADKPSMWGRSKPSSPAVSDADTPTIAANEQPPDSAVPLVAGSSASAGSYNKPSSRPSRNEVEVSSRAKAREREALAAKSKSKNSSSGSRTTASTTKSKSKTPEKSTASSSKTKSKTTASSSKTTKGKETASTSKSKSSTSSTKPKAASSRYTVKKGDSLSSIASRNKTSVSALQKANGIKGTTIQPGKTLTIPK
ncbi:LysM peptidoglycan-binding domain-containing protein [Luteolibacter ambystomatis]|uniref:LysM peptidoglycan-binding domain-containing protein n=1 Tax=Luteolibacter ambystomatis TaxID=2824561 RepID=A0A975IZN5_9BACT|nr:LysM peptidoglycan-binding domain-containing protein [Luteolibacter ambystomatis]QUE51512.1 LysM peptidoglycan-binding domain-containing protein [Luteolibacter ambystomatis]